MKKKIVLLGLAIVVLALAAAGLWYSRPMTLEQLCPGIDLAECQGISLFYFHNRESVVHEPFALTREDPAYATLLELFQGRTFRRSLLSLLPQGTMIHQTKSGDEFQCDLLFEFENVPLDDGNTASGFLLHFENFYGKLYLSYDGEIWRVTTADKNQWLSDVLDAIEAAQQEQEESRIDCVTGLLPDGQTGSRLVAYETGNWTPTVLLELPDVTPDNYAAVSGDGKYIAYTTWDDGNVRRYLKIYSAETGETTDFYRDLPAMNEIVDISWLPDNETLLFTLNDKSSLPYEEIRTLNVETEAESILVKGEVWQVRAVEDAGNTAEDFYLKGADQFLSVQDKKPADDNGSAWWNYYLTQDDIDQIYQDYGGVGQFSIEDIPSFFYVDFSRPRVSADGSSILFSATLERNSAMGTHTPLWMCSAIWEYSLTDQTARIVYAQTDGGAIGRVDWIENYRAVFISYYDFNGGRDSINLLDLSDGTSTTLFPYSDENYNNVTLLPVGGQKLTFTSSEKDATFEESVTLEYDLSSGACRPIEIQMDGATVFLEKFIYTRLVEPAAGSKAKS